MKVTGLPIDGVNVQVRGSPGDVDHEMQADVDAHAGGLGQPQQPMPDPAMMNQMFQPMFQQMMQQAFQSMMNNMFAQPAQGTTGQSPGVSSAAFSPSGADPRNWQGPANAGGWQHDRSLANVRLDERAFRRIDKFTDKPSEWTK